MLTGMKRDSATHITVLVTSPQDKAAEIASNLVSSKLAACVNIVPTIRSIYTWQSEMCDDTESLLVIKTRAALFEPLRKRVLELHPYDVPEVIAMPIVNGHLPYLQWVDESTES
jgi:periplasmic divalent cation tolerance protein